MPGSDDFLFLNMSPNGEREPLIYLATLHGGKAETSVQLLTGGLPAHYTPAGGGRLLFVLQR